MTSSGKLRTAGSVQPSVAIVLLNWNCSTDTLACINSLRRLTYKNFEIILVDNNSKASDYAALKEGCQNELVLRQKRNLGFAGGCNVGIRWALDHSFDYIWLLNSDTEPDPEALSALVNTMDAEPRIGIAGGVLYLTDDLRQIHIAGGFIDSATSRGRMLGFEEIDTGQYQGVFDVDYVSGGMLLARREAIRTVGLLDERFFMYYEDTDWGVRMRARNWRVATVAAAKAWHKDRASAGVRKMQYIEHGYFLFLYKNFRRNLPHALRIYARHYLRPHLERRQWRLAWADALVYLRFLSRLAFVRPNLQP